MSPGAPAFKVDENLPCSMASVLVGLGYDAVSVLDQGLRGASDDRLAEVCAAEQRVLVTLDVDFADIRRYPPAHYPGIIVLRLGSQDAANVERCLRRVAPLLRKEPIKGRLWIVDEQSVRVREPAGRAE